MYRIGIRGGRRLLASLFAVAIAWAFVVVPSVACALGNPHPSLVAVDGQKDAITVSWPVDTQNAGYVIWRSPDGTLTRARVLGVVQAADAKSFTDLTAILGAQYRYSVRAFTSTQSATAPGDADWTVAPVSLATPASSQNPHLGTRADLHTATCARCHSIMDAPVGSDAFLIDLGSGGSSAAELCLTCHEQSVGGGVQSVGLVFQSGRSGHSVDTSTSVGNGVDSCADCHNAHADSHAQTGLRPTNVRQNGASIHVDASANGWCLACHKDGSPLSDPVEPSLIKPSYDETTGYPAAGTFPGRDVYNSTAANVHASIVPTGTYSVETGMTHSDISRPAGDCRYCHASHRSASFYDALLVVNDAVTETYANHSESDVAPLCFRCHSDVRASLESTDAVHFVKSGGGVYQPGTALPCFVCHNPHGSARGNKLNISDTLGQDLDPRSTDPDKARQFCFTCHTTAEGKGWNSVEATYTDPPADAAVVGLSRVDTSTVIAGAPAPSKLRLSDVPEHLQGSSAACTGVCHDSAHVPSGGHGSAAAKSCYDCHSSLKTMDMASGQDTDTFHHVLGSAETSYTGGVFLSGYSKSGDAKYCTTCHVDHLSNPGEWVLRTSATNADAASSDLGLCTSCHGSPQIRSGENQKAAFARLAAQTPITSVRAIGATAYSASKHNYDVLTGTGNKGNCIKCHNAGETVGGSNLADFSLHNSVNQSLISRMGDESASTSWNSIPAQYKLCFQCHARYGDVAVSTAIGKDFVGKDWFGAQRMGDARSVQYKIGTTVIGTQIFNDEAVFSDMFKGGSGVDLSVPIDSRKNVSGHLAEKIVSSTSPLLKDPYRSSTTSVRCTDCHDVHKTSMGIMSQGQEWPFTTKLLPGTVVAGEPQGIRQAIESKGIASDGSRLITLNDFWYRENNLSKGTDWLAANTVTIFCFECHSEAAMTGKTHAATDADGSGGTPGLGHKNGFLACVNCHVPAIHGSGMPDLLADMSTGVMPEHQVIKWYDPFTNTNNKGTAKIYSVNTDFLAQGLKKQTGCSTAAGNAGCHGTLNATDAKVVGEQTGTGWSNWISSF